ncbi:MAG: matrixin family metalloprotease, partial [Bacteroidota bacterium]
MLTRNCGVTDAPFGLNFTTTGQRWNRTNLTYRFVSFTPDIPQADVRAAITTAFDMWSQVTSLTFSEITAGTPDILLNFVGSIPGTAAANANWNHIDNLITDSRVTFDDSEMWAFAMPIGTNSFDLVDFAAHEIGHCLGLGHSSISTAIMRPSFLSGTSQRSLDQDDINGIQSIYGSGSWSGWGSLGGRLSSGPDVCSWAEGRLDVFVRGADKALWHRWYDGSWSGWESLGGTLSSDPTAVSWSNGRIDVFVRGADNALWHRWYDGSWSGWGSLGGRLSSGPDVCSWAEGR